MKIIEMWKLAKIITVVFENGSRMTFSRHRFEHWADNRQVRVVSYPATDCESTAEDCYVLSWDKYYKEDHVLADIQTYLESERDELIDKAAKVLCEY